MAQSFFRAAAERHRQVANLLSDPEDQAIVNQYADDVESLSRFEVNACWPTTAEPLQRRICEIGFMLKESYEVKPGTRFAELLGGLGDIDLRRS